MAHYTLIARINAGDGKFPFVNVQFSKIVVRFRSNEQLLPPSERLWQAHANQERTIAISYTLLACLKNYRTSAPDDALIFHRPRHRRWIGWYCPSERF